MREGSPAAVGQCTAEGRRCPVCGDPRLLIPAGVWVEGPPGSFLSPSPQALPAGDGGGSPSHLPAVFLPAAALLRELRPHPAGRGPAAAHRPHPQPPQLVGGPPGSGAGHPGVLPSQPHHQVGMACGWGWRTGPLGQCVWQGGALGNLSILPQFPSVNSKVAQVMPLD